MAVRELSECNNDFQTIANTVDKALDVFFHRELVDAYPVHTE